MPKISDLPTDTEPATTDLIPFVDVDASRTESVTVANLAASTAFSEAYEPLQLIERATVTGSPAATIVLDDIPQTFQSLEIVLTGEATGSPTIQVRLNGDSGANYAAVVVATRSTAGTGSVAQAEGIASMLRCGGIGDNGGSVHMFMHGYARTDIHKNLIAFQSDARSATPFSFASFGSNVWRSDAAVTSIAISQIAGGNFSVGTVVSLYGRK